MLKDIEEALKTMENWDNAHMPTCCVYDYDRLTEEPVEPIARFEKDEHADMILKFPEWLRHLLSIISQKDEEIEKLRQVAVDSAYIIDRLISDYPTDLWTHEEEKSWKDQGREQLKDIKTALEENPHVNP